MNHRFAALNDAGVLGELNRQLIEDEGHGNFMSVPELTERMQNWIASDYIAILFEEDAEVVAYALYREEEDSVHLRQFFVQRCVRRSGVGRQCMEKLFSEVWPPSKRITVDVLIRNSPGISFWRAVGFSDYCITLEIPPDSSGKPGGQCGMFGENHESPRAQASDRCGSRRSLWSARGTVPRAH